MTTRELPPAEWDRLAPTELGPIRALLRPETTRVLVVEDADGAIVGAWSLMCAWHVEGLWIDPNHQRKGSVGRRLLTTMRRWVRDMGIGTVLTSSVTPEVDALLQQVQAQPVAASMWIWPLDGAIDADEARGAQFHRQLEQLLPSEAVHADDPTHTKAVGVALRLAGEWGPERAARAYSQWAAGAGYQPIESLRLVRDGVYEVNFATQRMQIGLDGTLIAVEEIVCQS